MKRYLIQFKFPIMYLSLMIVARQLLLVLAQQMNSATFNHLVAHNLSQFLLIIGIICLIWVSIIILDKIVKVFEKNTTQNIGVAIITDVSQQITNTSYQDFRKRSSEQYLSWLNNDVDKILSSGIQQYFNLLSGIAGVLFSSIALIQYHWSLLAITFLGFLCMAYIPKLFDKSIYQVGDEVTQANEQFISDIETQLKGYQVFFSFALLPRFIHKIKAATTALKEVLMKQVRLESTIYAVNFSINVFFQIVLTLVAGLC